MALQQRNSIRLDQSLYRNGVEGCTPAGHSGTIPQRGGSSRTQGALRRPSSAPSRRPSSASSQREEPCRLQPEEPFVRPSSEKGRKSGQEGQPLLSAAIKTDHAVATLERLALAYKESLASANYPQPEIRPPYGSMYPRSGTPGPGFYADGEGSSRSNHSVRGIDWKAASPRINGYFDRGDDVRNSPGPYEYSGRIHTHLPQQNVAMSTYSPTQREERPNSGRPKSTLPKYAFHYAITNDSWAANPGPGRYNLVTETPTAPLSFAPEHTPHCLEEYILPCKSPEARGGKKIDSQWLERKAQVRPVVSRQCRSHSAQYDSIPFRPSVRSLHSSTKRHLGRSSSRQSQFIRNRSKPQAGFSFAKSGRM